MIYYDAGFEAGLEGNDNCPYFPLTFTWWIWQTGHHAGHHTRCTQLEAIALLYPQD